VGSLVYGPTGLAADSGGSLYIVDHGNNRVRKVDPEGTITTVIGTGAAGDSGDGGPATKATLQEPLGIAVDRSGRIYLADRDNHRVRAVDTGGTITTMAGNGSIGPARTEGAATEAEFGLPIGVAAGPGGSVFISDESAHRVYKVDAEGAMTTFAGTGKAATAATVALRWTPGSTLRTSWQATLGEALHRRRREPRRQNRGPQRHDPDGGRDRHRGLPRGRRAGDQGALERALGSGRRRVWLDLHRRGREQQGPARRSCGDHHDDAP